MAITSRTFTSDVARLKPDPNQEPKPRPSLHLTPSEPPPPPEPPAPTPAPAACTVVDIPGGGLLVSFRIDPDVAIRLKRRSGTMPLARYLWESILHRAVVDSVY